MSARDKAIYAVAITLGLAIAWFTMLQPAARECANRGGHYYAWEGECGKFVFEFVSK